MFSLCVKETYFYFVNQISHFKLENFAILGGFRRTSSSYQTWFIFIFRYILRFKEDSMFVLPFS